MGGDPLEMNFPVAGIDQSDAFARQKPRDVGGGLYARTTPDAVNVVGYEATTGRKRGGSRPGLARWIAARAVAGWIVQGLGVIASTTFNGKLADGSYATPTDAAAPWEGVTTNWESITRAWEL